MKHQLDFEKPIVELQNKLEELKKHPETHSLDISVEEEVGLIEKKLEETKRQIFANLSAWDRIKIARHPKRPFTLDYLESAFTGFQRTARRPALRRGPGGGRRVRLPRRRTR